MKKHVFAQDTIRRIAHRKTDGESTGGLVLVDDKFSYYITQVDEKIELVVKQLNPRRLRMDRSTTITKNDNKFDALFRFDYDAGSDDYSEEEAVALTKGCEKRRVQGVGFLGLGSHTAYSCFVYVSGSLFATPTATAIDDIKLSQGRNVTIVVNDGAIDVIDSTKLYNKIIVLPFALAFDLITSPLQIILLSRQGK